MLDLSWLRAELAPFYSNTGRPSNGATRPHPRAQGWPPPSQRLLTRDQELRAADRVPKRLLDEVPELSHGDGDQGLLLQGDNLEARLFATIEKLKHGLDLSGQMRAVLSVRAS